MPKEYRLYVRQSKIKNTSVPVGSVLVVGDTKTYTRDIDSKVHIFAPTPQYQVIGIDEPAYEYLEADGVSEVSFYVSDKSEVWNAPLSLYKLAKPKKMMGREQRFVAVTKFDKKPGEPLPRPSEKVVV